jgi:hypothetical protein
MHSFNNHPEDSTARFLCILLSMCVQFLPIIDPGIIETMRIRQGVSAGY